MLKLMYITNSPEVAKIADDCGVDRVWIDLETKGKELRQPKELNTVLSHHSISDIPVVKDVLKKSELIVRINKIDTESSDEIEQVIEAGADIIMLPYFKTLEEVEAFLKYVGGRCKTNLLVETPEAMTLLDEILKLDGVDEIHFGLNDLHLALGLDFMFELLADGTIEKACKKVKKSGKPYGFGGIARIGEGLLPTESVIAEHYRLGSTCAILSRSFCNTTSTNDLEGIRNIFKHGIEDIRLYEKSLTTKDKQFFIDNQEYVKEKVKEIVTKKKRDSK